MALTAQDLAHLRRCVDLAEQAVESGDEPFGSILVDQAGAERFADHNRVSGGDHTQHPEFAIARWAAEHLSADERAGATVYTSGEHCLYLRGALSDVCCGARLGGPWAHRVCQLDRTAAAVA